MKKNKMLNNLGLKILAVLTAIVIWLIVVNISDPVISNPFSGIKVDILNTEVITSKNRVFEVVDGTDTITVAVSANRTIMDYLNASNIKATADMRELNEEDGTVRIRVESNRYNNKIDSMKPKTEYLKVKIENKKNAQFPIEAEVIGKPQDGYMVGNISMNQNIVYVSGAESIVSRIARVTAEVPVEGMAGSISTSMDLKYYDKKGNLIDQSHLTQNISNVDLKIEILKTKEAEVKAKTTGVPAAGYGLSGRIVISPAKVMIAGKGTSLNEVNEITIPENLLNVEGLTTNLETEVYLKRLLPDGIVLANEEEAGKVNVVVEIVELSSKTVEYPKSRIAIEGVPEKYTATFGSTTETITFDVLGLPEQLEGLDITQITAKADVEAYMETNDIASLKEESYLIPITLSLPNGITQKLPVNINIKFKRR